MQLLMLDHVFNTSARPMPPQLDRHSTRRENLFRVCQSMTSFATAVPAAAHPGLVTRCNTWASTRKLCPFQVERYAPAILLHRTTTRTQCEAETLSSPAFAVTRCCHVPQQLGMWPLPTWLACHQLVPPTWARSFDLRSPDHSVAHP